MKIYNGFVWLELILIGSMWGNVWAADPVSLQGRITDRNGPLEGAFVGAHAEGKNFTIYVMTDNGGVYTFRGLGEGQYTIFTRIRGYREKQETDVGVTAGDISEVDFQVEEETEFQVLVEQASNSELTESYPISIEEKTALDFRCGRCHGARYLIRSRFNNRDWRLIIAKMDDQGAITPAADITPPPRSSRPPASLEDPPPGSDDESIATLLTSFLGPDSPEFPIKFQPRPTGEATRAVVTEYKIPRLGAIPRDVLVDEQRSFVWYTDWKSNYLGRIAIETGEIKEYPVPEVRFRPPGMQELRFDPEGNIMAAQIWAGRAIRFNPESEQITGIWETPLEWARIGSVGVCQSRPDLPFRYLLADALEREQGWIVNPETDQMTEVGYLTDQCDRRRSYYNWSSRRGHGRYGGIVMYRNPETGETTEFTPLSPWSSPDNAIGDPVRNVGWSVPFVGENVIKANLDSGEVKEFPLPNHGERVHNVDLDMTTDPPSLWFVNLRLGMVVRFQEYLN